MIPTAQVAWKSAQRRIAAHRAVQIDEIARTYQPGRGQRAARAIKRPLRVEAFEKRRNPAAITRIGQAHRILICAPAWSVMVARRASASATSRNAAWIVR